eukprot:419908_1
MAQHEPQDEDNILSVFSRSDLDDMSNMLTDINELKENELKENEFRTSWMNVANCIKQEMYSKLASFVQSMIQQHNIGIYDLDDRYIETIMMIFEKRNPSIQEKTYLHKLIQRAKLFVPIDSSKNKYNEITNRDENQLQKPYLHDLHDLYNNLERNNIPSEEIKKLNKLFKNARNQNEMDVMEFLQSILDVHRHFCFSNHHFEDYKLKDFYKDISNIAGKYLSDKFVKTYISNMKFKNRFNFNPSYIINDDMFEIMKYHFRISEYVSYLTKEINIDKTPQFELKAVVIPKSIISVYDDNLIFNYGSNIAINNIDRYLLSYNKSDYIRVDAKKYIKEDLQNLYNIKDISRNNITKLMIIIDRRHKKDTLRLFPCRTFDIFAAATNNYFIGFDFHMHLKQNTIRVYLRYGFNEKLRFYPEMLVSLIPRLFKKRSSNIGQAQILDKLYSNEYNHGWSFDLNDDLFNTFYKMITSYTHISNKYKRHLLGHEPVKYQLFFRDILDYELQRLTQDKASIQVLNEFLFDNEYDSETIIDDVSMVSNIQIYLSVRNLDDLYNAIKETVQSFTDPASIHKSQLKECNATNIKDVADCSYVNQIVETLDRFNEDNLTVYKDVYNVSSLLGAYDHIIDIHRFSFNNTTETMSKKLKSYVSNVLGPCNLSSCTVLKSHTMRNRQRKQTQVEAIDEDSLQEIISSTVVALHCYLLHEQKQLFRLARANTQQFIKTIAEEEADQEPEAISIDLGVSVLQWLKF